MPAPPIPAPTTVLRRNNAIVATSAEDFSKQATEQLENGRRRSRVHYETAESQRPLTPPRSLSKTIPHTPPSAEQAHYKAKRIRRHEVDDALYFTHVVECVQLSSGDVRVLSEKFIYDIFE